jgi:hypothetical protein
MNGHWRPSIERREALAVRLHRRRTHWASDIQACYPRFVGPRPINPRLLPGSRRRTPARLRQWRPRPWERGQRSGRVFAAVVEAIYCYRLGWKLELEAAAREAWRARPDAGPAPRRAV